MDFAKMGRVHDGYLYVSEPQHRDYDMTVADIEALAAGGESETVELKASTGQRVAGAMAVCAMLNHRGGTVLFGVQPDRHVSGQTVSDRTIEQLSSTLSESTHRRFLRSSRCVLALS